MYEELLKRLRKRAVNLKEKFSRNAELLLELTEAADAIEELSKRVPPVLHGRLIDADALPINEPIRSMMVFGGEIVIAKSAIDDAPTVISADHEEEEMK